MCGFDVRYTWFESNLWERPVGEGPKGMVNLPMVGSTPLIDGWYERLKCEADGAAR